MLGVLIVLPIQASAGGRAPAPKKTAPPQIYRVLTTPLCARLHDRVRPAVALILQNDGSIAKSPALFKKYSIGAFNAEDPARDPAGNPAPAMNDSINVDSPATRMALQQMSYLVSPIAQNLISSQTLLDDPDLRKPTGNRADDQKLATIRKQLLETIAFQSASLDLINGFVATQQMGALQHAGETYIHAIQGGNTTTTISSQTPSPLQDPNSPGLPPNPYQLDLAAVPGLSVGYNPLSRIVDGLQWTRTETGKRENAAAGSLMSALSECGPAPSPAAVPLPAPATPSP
jgi:hypothetical protein